jgi:diguanylate cyclase (GGDEF)-like protein/PAS domain S-box-containing protein
MDESAADPFDETPALRVGPEELVDDRYLLDAFLENTPDHVYFKDHESRFIRISEALASWLGLADAAEAIGRSDFDFFGEEHARKAFADEQHLMRTGEALIGIEERETWEDGHETWVSTTKAPLRDRRGRIVGVFGLSRDITEKKLNEQRLATQAERLEKQARALEELTLVDDLTQLHNRRAFAGFGEEALYRARRDGTLLALLFIDIDEFKQINDTFGHGAGDEALQTVADVIRKATREADIAARIGGDEFCILLTGKDATAVESLVERIRAGLDTAHREGTLAFELSVSVGTLHVDPRTPGSLEEMLAKADRSMYSEKLGNSKADGQTAAGVLVSDPVAGRGDSDHRSQLG